MTRAKKVILALICAAALCCAAIGGVLLARQPAHAAAGDVTALEIVIPDNTRFYVFEDLADVKGKITVNAEIEGGSSRQLDASEYVLSVQGRGDMTEANGVTFGGASIREYTLVATYAAEDVAQVSGQRTIEVRPDEYVQIKAEYTGSAIYPYTNVESTQFKRDVEAYIFMASQVASEPQGQGARLQATDYVLSAEDLSAPATKVEGGTYTREVTLTYTGEGLDEIYEDTVTFEVPVKPVKVVSIEALGTPEAAIGDTFDVKTMIEDQGITFYVGYNESNLFGNAEVEWDETKFTNIRYTTYDPDSEAADENGYVIDATKTTFSWVSETNGLERIYFTYTENAVPVDGFIDVQVRRTPYTESPITTDREYGYGDRDNIAPLTYLMTVDEESGEVTGKAWEISIGNSQYPFRSEIVEISVWKDGKDISEDVVANIEGQQSGKINLTDVGTYTIRLTLISDMYYWSTHADDQEDRDIEYTVTIIPAELVGTEFTFGGGWTYGEEANLPTEIKLVSRVDEDTTAFAPPKEAEIKVTFTGTANDGTQQTYSYTYTQGSQPSVTPGTNVPSLAGSYTVYVEVTGMANYADVTLESCSAIEGSKFQQTEFTIARKAVALPELQDENDKQENEELGVIDYPYTGREITVDYTSETDTAISGGSYAASGTTKSTAAGDYTVTFALADKNNTRWASETLPTTPAEDDTADKTLTWYIVKADNEITGVSALGWTYGEAVIKPQITGSTFAENTHDLGDWSAAAITYRYNGAAFDEQADTLGWNVGEYTYTITYEGNANINDATYTGTFTVVQGQAVIDGTPTIDGWTYGGTGNEPSGVTDVTVGGDSQVSLKEDGELPGYYAYYGKTNGDTAYASENSPSQTAPKAAGTYYVVYVVKETDNYKGATAMSEEFIISRASISPAVTINGQSSDAGWVYDGEEKAAAVTGNLGKGSVTYTYAGRNHTTYGGSVQPTDAGEYTVTAAVAQTDNYEAGEATLDFTISQKGVTVALASDTQYTYTGAAVNVVLTVDGNQVDLTDNEYFTVVSGCADTDAGSYTATIAWKGNYKANGTADDFATAQRSKEVGTWTIDPFAVSLPDELAKTSIYSYNDQFVGTQQTWKWDNYNGFGTALRSGTPFSVTVSAADSGIAEGSYGSQANGQESGYLFATEAGVYTFTLELTSTKNFVWVSGGTDAKTLTWTIGKAEVSVDVGERQLEYDGNKKAPANIVDLNAGDTSVPSAYQNLYTIAGYAAGTTSTEVGTEAPNDFGTYYVAIDLKDGDNFVWEQAEQSQDVASGDRLFIWYQITGTTYEITIGTISDWTYGTGTPSVPTLSGDTAILQDVIENYGSAITYTYQRQGEGGQWTNVYEVSYDSDDASYLLSVVPAEVAGTAGTYRLIVNVSEPSSHNYAAIVDEYSNTFTIGQRELTDVQWSGLTGSYTGSARGVCYRGNGLGDGERLQ